MKHRPTALAFGLVLAMSVAPAGADSFDIGGRVEMGVVGMSSAMGDTSVAFRSDLDLHLRLSRTLDSGLTIAVEMDLDDLLTETPRPVHLPARPVEE